MLLDTVTIGRPAMYASMLSASALRFNGDALTIIMFSLQCTGAPGPDHWCCTCHLNSYCARLLARSPLSYIQNIYGYGLTPPATIEREISFGLCESWRGSYTGDLAKQPTRSLLTLAHFEAACRAFSFDKALHLARVLGLGQLPLNSSASSLERYMHKLIARQLI